MRLMRAHLDGSNIETLVDTREGDPATETGRYEVVRGRGH
jgi:hypothetical protein